MLHSRRSATPRGHWHTGRVPRVWRHHREPFETETLRSSHGVSRCRATESLLRASIGQFLRDLMNTHDMVSEIIQVAAERGHHITVDNTRGGEFNIYGGDVKVRGVGYAGRQDMNIHCQGCLFWTRHYAVRVSQPRTRPWPNSRAVGPWRRVARSS